MKKPKLEFTKGPSRFRLPELIKFKGRKTPTELIDWIDINYPDLNGLCYYDAENKCLGSADMGKVDFHYDPYHGVLAITRSIKTK